MSSLQIPSCDGILLLFFSGAGSLLIHHGWNGAAVLLWGSGPLSYHQDVFLAATVSTPGLMDLICTSAQTLPGKSLGSFPCPRGSASHFIRVGSVPSKPLSHDITLLLGYSRISCLGVLHFLSTTVTSKSFSQFLCSEWLMPPCQSPAMLSVSPLSMGVLPLPSSAILFLPAAWSSRGLPGFHFSLAGLGDGRFKWPVSMAVTSCRQTSWSGLPTGKRSAFLLQ